MAENNTVLLSSVFEGQVSEMGLQGCSPSGDIWKTVSLPFPALENAHIPWLMPRSSTCRANSVASFALLPCLPLLRTLVMTSDPRE